MADSADSDQKKEVEFIAEKNNSNIQIAWNDDVKTMLSVQASV